MKKWFMLTAILALGLVLMLGGCSEKKEEAPSPAPAPEPETEPESEPEPVVEDNTPAPTQDVEIDTEAEEGDKIAYGSRGILSDVKCEDGVISGIITNAFLDTEQTVAVNEEGRQQQSDVRIQVNGMNIYDYTCDKESIGPDEHTYCEDLMGKLKVKVRTTRPNEIAVWFDADRDNRGVTTVECSEVPEVAEE